MHDLKWIRDNPKDFDAGMQKRGLQGQSAHILTLDEQRRKFTTQAQEMLARRNDLSKKIGDVKKSGGDAADLQAEVTALKSKLPELEEQQKKSDVDLTSILETLPNILQADVPIGTDEMGNKEVGNWGTKPSFSFTPKQHFEIGEALGQMDFESAGKIAGARFVLLSNKIAKLQRALGAFMLDLHTREFGYTEFDPPLMVNSASLYGTGQLPKFDNGFQVEPHGYYLIPTSEVPLTNLVRESIVAEDSLPRRYTALTPCFRSEAGAAGKDTRGMLRQHQFMKVELVSITHPDHSRDEHERMRKAAETVLQRLEIPYRVMLLCSGDTGFASSKTYDIEVWLPGQNAYREISSCSNCLDFQARRMNARFKDKSGQNRFVHTLNGSGVAVGRALIAVLENYQQPDGSVKIPEALRPYTGFDYIAKE